MNTIVELNRLTKKYGEVVAVDEVSFTLEEGKIYGLLGRNGAGKTTIMHMLTAQLFSTSGELKVFGQTPYENNHVLSQLCFIKENQKYPEAFRVRDVLLVAKDVFASWDQDYAMRLIEDFRLPMKRRVKALSRGLLSTVGIIVGLASRARLTIFDEPYLGLDAVARGMFYDLLLEDYTENPRTIVLSTHLIDEVSRLLEHILVIDGGKLILNEEAESLRGRAHTVVGSATKVESFIQGKEIIAREPFGSLLSATIFGSISASDKQEADAQGVELAPISLQQLIIHLTQNKSLAKGA
jgi:ABC-2 type transport system ATP-binding protein